MFRKLALLSFTTLAVVRGQQVGTQMAETHPRLTWQRCTKAGGCSNQQGSVVLDANWRWLHSTSGYTNCYTGSSWDATLCPNPTTCATNCALDGADYPGTYGISTTGNSLKLNFITRSSGTNVGSRVYLMASDTRYEMFKLLNKEFTFDVDVSNLPCGLNGALYFSEMDADGGMAKHPTNKAGAKYGTGYCDSQCAKDLKFIDGEANVLDWEPSESDPSAGTGRYGACCNEMDIWEANSVSTAYTPHPCTNPGLARCEGTDCVSSDSRYAGFCDPDGCDFNSFRMGNQTFYGKSASMNLNTNQKMTVVTQFLTYDGTDTGELKEIRRIYVQNGRIIQNSKVNVPGIPAEYDSITSAFCAAQKGVFGDTNAFADKGGLSAMGQSFARGVVLVMSVWDDHAANMLWLDSTYPTDADPSKPGAARGSCATSSGDPKAVEAQSASSSVTFSNIRFGDLDSTYSAGNTGGSPGSPPATPPANPTVPAPAATQTKYGQCGGQGWSGPTACAAGSRCQAANQYYSQCI